jgi:hypothetical protein
LFPLLSESGGYPSGFDKSNFLFITPWSRTERNGGLWKVLISSTG